MKLFEILSRKSPNKVAASLTAGLIAGVAYAMLIPIILSALEEPVDRMLQPIDFEPFRFLNVEISEHRFALFFVVVCLTVLIFRSASQLMLTRVSMEATADLRKLFYRRVSQLPIAQLEQIGSSRIMAVLTNDVPRVVQGAGAVPDVLISVLTIFGLLGFLLYLNVDVFYFILGAIGFGIISYQLPIMLGAGYYRRSRKYVDALHESIKGLVWGAKELKLNEKKRKHYFEDFLYKNEDEILKNEKTGYSIMQIANNYGDLISFLVIGMVAFVFVNYRSIRAEELVGIVMALLYLTGPIAGILKSIPMISLGRVSLERLNQLLDEMEIEESFASDDAAQPQWKQIQIKTIGYDYNRDPTKSSFRLGPVDLTLNKGEITFIVGGNGSGKSTLGKIISLHYLPSEGCVSFDNVDITSLNRTVYRQEIASIYSDYYLFDQFYGISKEEIEEKIGEYLELLKLKEKITIEDNRFSTISLSDGQRRRLALIVSFLEEKSLYVFDEWAADQDPEFKQIFYYEILPRLKAKGKAVVVVSHDDRYFGVADKLVTMEAGRVLRVELKDPADALMTDRSLATS